MPEIFYAFASILMVAISQLLFKAAMSGANRNGGKPSIREIVFSPKIALGLILNFGSALCWIIALRKLQINFLYPLLCLNYLLVPLGAWCLFHERIGRRRGIAICVICIGVFICLLDRPS